jgi:hypothetical protein
MTHLVARLILTMLILPIAGAVFVLCFVAYTVIFATNTVPPAPPLFGLWAIVYLVIAFTWITIWRPVVRWTPRRVAQTVVSAVAALAAGAAFGFTIWSFTGATGAPPFVSVLLGGGVPPIVWVLSTVLTWRETAGERTERLAGRPNGGEPVVCPMCGYDMSGAPSARCPECGVAFTIGELVAAQPQRALRTLDDE